MFEEQRRDDVEAMIESNFAFARLYQRHRKLDDQVHEAERGALPIDEMSLAAMKKQKLHTKEQLQQMWDNRTQQAG